ncbi:MAG: PaaI family thioesterase [Phycisphaeraceae bacterium]|nr:PaaI family thioesterase [Phycisphaeraceae bacterium]MCB9847118.1 PaaI family thioesterase [Phycisphaeraceae bacterium]
MTGERDDIHEMQARIAESFARQGLMGRLGAELASVRPGEVSIRLPFSGGVSQQHGYFHAGAIASVADSAAGYAGLSLAPAGMTALAVEFKINLLRPGVGDAVVARGSVLRQGRQLSVCQASVWIEEGGELTKQCAQLQQTLMILPADEGRPAG